MLSLSDHNPELFSPATKYLMLCLQADAYFYCSQFKQAEVFVTVIIIISCEVIIVRYTVIFTAPR